MNVQSDHDVKVGFSSLKLSPALLQVLEEVGYQHMTRIQAQSIPIILGGSDFIGQSKTGSGKTAAFALPILEKVQIEGRRLQAMVLCPTRELCAQVAREIRKLARRQQGLQVLVLAGGQPMAPQVASLEKGVHIVVGTPGRVLDHLSKKNLTFKYLRQVVLDEADRMLDMGFADEVECILKETPIDRQTIFFSATFPETINALSDRYQKNPCKVTMPNDDAEEPSIRQFLLEIELVQKTKALLYILQKHKPSAVIVFCNFKAGAATLERDLDALGVSAAALHGDLEQYERDRVMARFRNRSVRVLISTDVAARGIDIESVDLVINFDLPQKPETYVHRIGRTGRAGKSGLAISLITTREMEYKLIALEAFLGQSLERMESVTSEVLDAACQRDSLRRKAEMETLFISSGRKNKIRPTDILGALTGSSVGLPGSSVGKIEIHDHFSYVAIAKDQAQQALCSLRNANIKGRKCKIEIVR